MQPKWVHTPMQISHSGFLQRSASVAGSRMEGAIGSSFFAEAICSGVRFRTNTGLERHFTVKFWPTRMGRRSTSTIPAANTSFAGHRVRISLPAIARMREAAITALAAVMKYTKGRRSAWPMGRRLARKSKAPSGTVLVGIGAFSAKPTGRKFSGENFAIDTIAGSLGSYQTSVRVTVAPEASSPLERSGFRGKVGSRMVS
eukprot:Skav230582  [mRNA]  locus=scaffold1455:35052:35654:+ [translate_table: standard]